MAKKLTHARYIVYRDDSHQKKVAIWFGQDAPIHSTYACKHNIPTTDFCAGGYLGVKHNRWIIYEHYPVSETSKAVQNFNKRLVMTEFQKLPEYANESLKRQLAETYRQEKHLMLYALKNLFTRGRSS